VKAVQVQAGQRVRVRFSAPPPPAAEVPDGPALIPE
jgi:hypothetical protein